MKEVAPHIYSRWEAEDLGERLRKVDLVLIDLDDCLYPGTTNLTLLKNLFLVLLRNREYKVLFRLIGRLPVLFIMKCRQLLGAGVDNPGLSLFFYRMITNIPFSYLQAAACSIPPNSFAGARETLSIFSRRARTGLVSLGLNVVLEEYKKQFREEESLIDFYDGTQAELLNSLDKGSTARQRIKEFSAKMPLVLGHNEDDLGMIMAAKEAEGLVIGFNPSRKVMRCCDVIVKAKDWQPLAKYLRAAHDNENRSCAQEPGKRRME